VNICAKLLGCHVGEQRCAWLGDDDE